MQSLFQGQPFQPESQITRSPDGPRPCVEPHILLEITPWHQVFFTNLCDCFLFFRRQPKLELTSSPGEFWPDVFVNRRLPVRPFWESGLCHIFVVLAMLGISQSVLFRTQPITLKDPFEHSTITYYRVSEYLPPIKAADEPTPAKLSKKGEPVYAKQKIVSRRPNSESRTQTIVSPPQVRLPVDIRVPNMVAWNPAPAVPHAMALHSGLNVPTPEVVPPRPTISRTLVSIPNQNASVVPPAPNPGTAKLHTPLDVIARTVVPPSPVTDGLSVNTPNLPLASAVEPPVTPPRSPLSAGDLNIGSVAVVPPAPALPVPEQRARGSLVHGAPASSGLANAMSSVNATVVPPPPSGAALAGGSGGGANGSDRFIALSINPTVVSGPIPAPPGNRSGTFAAGPEGKPGASGTPEVKGGGSKTGLGGSGASNQGERGANGPAGVYVERGPTTPPHDSIVVSGELKPSDRTSANTTNLASLSRPKLADIARETRNSPRPESPSSALEREVFGSKKFYSMILNMPNLTSHGGSWIIRFAELKVDPQGGNITTPVATRKVDPAYPSELMRERVEGTVILYAIIRANGNVEDVRVLRGVDGRLDENACSALKKWRFRPGSKNGAAVDVEAIVQIPFVSRTRF